MDTDWDNSFSPFVDLHRGEISASSSSIDPRAYPGSPEQGSSSKDAQFIPSTKNARTKKRSIGCDHGWGFLEHASSLDGRRNDGGLQ